MRKTLNIVTLVMTTFVLSNSALAVEVALPAVDNCFITTTTEYKDGDVKQMTQAFFFKSKKDCEKSKKTLSQNFDPRRIKKVTGKLDWRGK